MDVKAFQNTNFYYALIRIIFKIEYLIIIMIIKTYEIMLSRKLLLFQHSKDNRRKPAGIYSLIWLLRHSNIFETILCK